MISLCLIHADYYMCYPIRDLDTAYSEFRANEIRQVPVIQVFGSTSTGVLFCFDLFLVTYFDYNVL